MAHLLCIELVSSQFSVKRTQIKRRREILQELKAIGKTILPREDNGWLPLCFYSEFRHVKSKRSGSARGRGGVDVIWGYEIRFLNKHKSFINTSD
jgi:hypothetical protein